MRALTAVLLTVLPSPAGAQVPYDNYPVCLRVYQRGAGWSDECRYTSIPQCQATASGRAAECITNPWYQPPAGPRTRAIPRT
jgi:hypothetical protein